MALHLVVIPPKAKYRSTLKTFIAVLETESMKEYLTAAEEKWGGEESMYCRPRSHKLVIGEEYYV